jgi:glucosamine 6-phosphate synthetase-like amidotransferase/phosphosugar isomerase protein
MCGIVGYIDIEKLIVIKGLKRLEAEAMIVLGNGL